MGHRRPAIAFNLLDQLPRHGCRCFMTRFDLVRRCTKCTKHRVEIHGIRKDVDITRDYHVSVGTAVGHPHYVIGYFRSSLLFVDTHQFATFVAESASSAVITSSTWMGGVGNSETVSRETLIMHHADSEFSCGRTSIERQRRGLDFSVRDDRDRAGQ